MTAHRKGQSALLTQAILVGVSLTLVTAVVYTFTNLREDYQDFIAASELDQACLLLQSAAEKVYHLNAYQSPSNTTYGRVRVVLPVRIGDLRYRTFFDNRTLFIETFGPVLRNASCSLGFNATYSGFTTGGVTEVRYDVLDNTTRRIIFEKVG